MSAENAEESMSAVTDRRYKAKLTRYLVLAALYGGENGGYT